MSTLRKTIQYGNHTLTLSTGEIARQADGAVVASLGDTMVLATAVYDKRPSEPRGFFPLTVNYQERTYAAGRVPGGFFRREGRPTEKEILTSRLIDRSIRPLFNKNFTQEIQVVATVLSMDPDINPDIPAMIAAAAAVRLAGLPASKCIAAARVGYIGGKYVLNPGYQEIDKSKLDLIVAGTSDAVIMVESEAEELGEDVMLAAVEFGHEKSREVIELIESMATEIGVKAVEVPEAKVNTALTDLFEKGARAQVEKACAITDKLERQSAIAAVRESFAVEATQASVEFEAAEANTLVHKAESKHLRQAVLEQGRRLDGRSPKDVRPITSNVGVLPRAHGSALFTRGETQALVSVTLGTARDARIVDALEGEYRESFMLHYNFPPYCVGEVGRMMGTSRREVGHGKLAKRALMCAIPGLGDNFPYVLRIVSEITESNGSSSMATVCGGSLALMDAGIEIKSPVAGIAMGLIKEGDSVAILSDIMGSEDHLGDMDFKVAGTGTGITALQMDIKIEGITSDIMRSALDQAREGRVHILAEMAKSLSQARTEMSEFAPRYLIIKVSPDKIREIIGKGGVTIREIQERTGATIDIDDDGTVKISSVDREGGEIARQNIEDITAEAEVNKIYEGVVVKIMEFGAFVNILPGKDGLVHISQISDRRVKSVSDVLQEGEKISVKVLEIDRQGRIRLTMKNVNGDSPPSSGGRDR